MFKKYFTIVCLIVLAVAAAPVMSQLPAPLDSANVVWQMGDFSDENGPPYSVITEAPDSTTGVDVSSDGIIAPNCDGLAVKNDAWSYDLRL